MAFKNAMGLKPFANKVWLSTPTKHAEELEYVTEAFETTGRVQSARTSMRWRRR